jgi:endonuclease/exonuclease/phosphatase family metal-dependent hydrolase
MINEASIIRMLNRVRALLHCLLMSLVAVSSVHAQATVQSVRFLTLNVDFNNTSNEIKADVQAVASYADVMMFQEAKTVTIDNFLGTAWTVYQVVDQGDAKRGSALAVRNSVINRKLGQGIVKGVDADGVEMLDRYIVWMDVELINGQVLRLMCLHMPPKRFDFKQPPMADSLVTLVNGTPYPVVVGGDWNYTVENDPYGIQRRTGLVPRGVGIDGFYRDRTVVKFTSMAELLSLNVNSDHDPVQMITSVSPPVAGVSGWSLY